MTSKRRIPLAVIASLFLAGPATAADLPTAMPAPVIELQGLSLPSDVAIGRDGQVYVVDSGNHQVAVFDASGQRTTSLGMMGSDEGQFLDPLGIDTGPGGDVYVADKGNKRIVVFDANGDYRRKLTLSVDDEAVVPVDVAVDARGQTLFITDNAAHRVAVFDVRGKFLHAFGAEGDADGQFRFPATIDVDAAGNVYVVDVLNARVQKFNADGEHLLTIGELGGKAGTFYRPKGVAASDDGSVVIGFGAVFLDGDSKPTSLGSKVGVADITPAGDFIVGHQNRPCMNKPNSEYPVPVYWKLLANGSWQMNELAALDGVDSEALGVGVVNGRTIIVGWGFTKKDAIMRAVAWLPDAQGRYGAPTRLAAIEGRSKSWARARDVNGHGQVVGTSAVGGLGRAAVLWTLPKP
jgi:hypothetical protein